MAKLPTKDNLSGAVSLRSGRAIASIDESGLARGLASAGSDIASLGAQMRQQDNTVDIARAEAYKTEQFLETQNRFQNDPDYSTFRKRAPQQTEEIIRNGANLIRDRNMRERWIANAQGDAARVNDSIFDHGNTIKRQAEISAFDDALETDRRLYVDPNTDDATKNKALSDIEGAIEEGLATGLLTPAQADARRKQYIEDADYNRGLLAVERNPNIVANGFEATLLKRESGGRPDVVNKWGYAGLYQFGAPRLAELGLYDPQGENLEGWSKRTGAQGKWTGRFSIPGHPDVRTLPDFLANPAAQRTAFGLHRRKMDEDIARRGLDQYIGQTVNGVKITRDGIHAMMHLGGVGGATRALTSGGSDNPADANGTTVLDYARMGTLASEDMPDWYQRLSPERRQQVLDKAIASENALLREADAQQKAQYTAYKDSLELGILTGGVTSEVSILDDPTLNDGDKATLLRTFRTQMEDTLATTQAIAEFASGSLNIDPYDSDGRKVVDNVYDEFLKTVPPQEIQPVTEELVRQTGIVPKRAMSAIRVGMESTDVAQVQMAAQAAQRLSSINPAALARREGGQGVQDFADDFSFYINTLDLSPEDAARRLMEARQPEKQRQRAALEPMAKDFVKEMADEDLTAVFDDSWFSDPQLGFTPAQEAGIKSEFVAIAEDAFFRSQGDVELAKNRAVQTMKRLYGVTRLTGSPVVMKHPPEKYWPTLRSGIRGKTLDYATMQLETDLKQFDPNVSLENVQLVTTPATDRMIKRGELPGYAVLYKDANGNFQTIPGTLWRPDLEAESERFEIEAQQQQREEADRLERARRRQESEGKLRDLREKRRQESIRLGGQIVPQQDQEPEPTQPDFEAIDRMTMGVP